MKTKEGTPIKGRIGTFTGRWFFPLNPKSEDINALDICHSLSNQSRFTGHTREFYSVAEHSCRVHDILPKEYKLWGLLHDATEAYLVDLPAPLKEIEQLKIFKEIENKIMTVICEKFNLEPEMPEIVHEADKILLYTEIRDLMMFQSNQNGYKPLEEIIYPWNPIKAKSEMMYRMERLGIEVTK